MTFGGFRPRFGRSGPSARRWREVLVGLARDAAEPWQAPSSVTCASLGRFSTSALVIRGRRGGRKCTVRPNSGSGLAVWSGASSVMPAHVVGGVCLRSAPVGPIRKAVPRFLGEASVRLWRHRWRSGLAAVAPRGAPLGCGESRRTSACSGARTARSVLQPLTPSCAPADA